MKKKVVKQEKNKQPKRRIKNNNPTGKGGFRERPEAINRDGRGKGAMSMKTKIRRAINVLAERMGKTPEEIEDNLFIVGYSHAQKGDYNFWKAIMEYIYGVIGDSPENPMHISLSDEAAKRAKKYK